VPSCFAAPLKLPTVATVTKLRMTRMRSMIPPAED
jgi:hypothetical protein